MTPITDETKRANLRLFLRSIVGDKNILLALILLSAAATVFYVAGDYQAGTLRRMGPGYFPVLLSAILALFALGFVARRFLIGADPVENVEIRPAFFVLGGVTLFGLLLHRAGLIASIV